MAAVLILPAAAAAAVLYACGSLGVKKALQQGTNARRATAVTNLVMAAWSVPLLIFFRGDFDLVSWFVAIGAGSALFAGRILAVKALEVGDLSVVGPLLGMKTLLVAIFAWIAGQTEFSVDLWSAVLLASVGIVLLQRGPDGERRSRGKAALYAFGASLLFAVCDTLVVQARSGLAVGWLTPTLFFTVALLVPTMGSLPQVPGPARKPLAVGSVVMGFQTTLVIFLIASTGQAVLINVIYSTRALWSVVIDRIAHRQGVVRERFATRMIGAVCLVAAVVIVILGR